LCCQDHVVCSGDVCLAAVQAISCYSILLSVNPHLIDLPFVCILCYAVCNRRTLFQAPLITVMLQCFPGLENVQLLQTLVQSPSDHLCLQRARQFEAQRLFPSQYYTIDTQRTEAQERSDFTVGGKVWRQGELFVKSALQAACSTEDTR
jgi:hypothetical protein